MGLFIGKGFVQRSYLLRELIKREIHTRYKGSIAGLFWLLFQPILMLSLYTFFFGVILQTRWREEVGSTADFALLLFPGLIIFTFFSESVTRAPSLITNNVSYVKKIVFPLEVLSIVSIVSAIIQLMISVVVWAMFCLLLAGEVKWTLILLPLVLIPLFLMTLGISWFLSAITVYVKDVAHLINPLVSGLMFLSPVFYSIERLPENMRFLYYWNPLSSVIEQARKVMFYGELVDWSTWWIGLFISLAILFAGYFFFMKTKKGFADVV